MHPTPRAIIWTRTLFLLRYDYFIVCFLQSASIARPSIDCNINRKQKDFLLFLCLIYEVGCTYKDSGSYVDQSHKYKKQHTKYKIQITKYKIQNCGYKYKILRCGKGCTYIDSGSDVGDPPKHSPLLSVFIRR